MQTETISNSTARFLPLSVEPTVVLNGMMTGGFSKAMEIAAAAHPDPDDVITPTPTTNNCLGGNCVKGCGKALEQ